MVNQLTACCCLTLLAGSVLAKELTEADFLAEIPVVLTSSRLLQPLPDAPSAITVIDRAMIEASGFRKIADLFRLAPGFYVGWVNGHNASVSNAVSSEFSRQMQVLVDGRSVYLPSIGGVRWDNLPLAVDDIERIEIVRGPNAASYGANALTGIINIITSHPAEVEGKRLTLEAAERGDQAFNFRWAGGDLHKHRVSLGWQRDEGFTDDYNLYDDAVTPLFNYQGDFFLGGGRDLTLRAGYTGGRRGEGAIPSLLDQPHDETIRSHFQQADLRITDAGGGEFLFKAYHDVQDSLQTVPVAHPMVTPGATYERDLRSERWHGEAQWNLQQGERLRYTLGFYGRRDAVNSLHYFNRTDDLVTWNYGAFGHAEWRLHPHWLLNAGAMWEKHDLGGAKLSPRVALNWRPRRDHTFRLGVSRAYRNPVQFESNADWSLRLPPGIVLPLYVGNPNVESESNLSREIGYLGFWPKWGLTLDARVYRDRLRDIIDVTGRNPRTLINAADSDHAGMDGQLRWQFAPQSFVVFNYAQLHIDTAYRWNRYFPRNVASLLVSHRYPQGVEISLGHYRASAFETLDSNDPTTYRRTDLRLAKDFKLEGSMATLSLGLQRLEGDTLEFDKVYYKRAPAQAFVKLQVDF